MVRVREKEIRREDVEAPVATQRTSTTLVLAWDEGESWNKKQPGETSKNHTWSSPRPPTQMQLMGSSVLIRVPIEGRGTDSDMDCDACFFDNIPLVGLPH